MESQKKGLGRIDGMVLERLLASLPAMVLAERHPSFLETVAVQEISGVVSRVVAELTKHSHVSFTLHPRRTSIAANVKQGKDVSRVLTLPLTEDKYLKHTIDLSLGYYKSVMAGGR
jgi:nuclear pore complex protein Nup98-Nup96